jgi:hypothetical protein
MQAGFMKCHAAVHEHIRLVANQLKLFTSHIVLCFMSLTLLREVPICRAVHQC